MPSPAAMPRRAAMIRLVRYALAFARRTLVLAALVLMPTAVAVAAEQVDLLLVLSSDVSRSVDHPKFLLQREGYASAISDPHRSEEHTSELQSLRHLVCRLLLE